MPGGDENPQLIRVIGDMVDEAAKASESQPTETPGTTGKDKPAGKTESEGKSLAAGEGEGRGDRADTFYVYVDNDGIEHIVDSLKLVPKKLRSGAKKWVIPASEGGGPLNDRISEGLSTIAKTVETVATPPPIEPGPKSTGLHVPSLLIGLVAGAVIFIGSFVLRRRTPFFVKAVLAVVVAAIAGVAYLGWVRRQAGLSDAPIARPSVVLEDARRAAETLDQHHRDQKRMIEEIDEEPEKSYFR